MAEIISIEDICKHELAVHVGWQESDHPEHKGGFVIANCYRCGSTINVSDGYRKLTNITCGKKPIYRKEYGRGR